MTQERISRIHRIYGIILSIVLTAASICLMAGCLGIYYSGDKPYSSDAVAAAFSPIAFVIYLCLVLVILGFLLDLFLPQVPRRSKAQRLRKQILTNLYASADLDHCGDSIRTELYTLRRSRNTSAAITALLLTIGAAVFLVFVLNRSHFTLTDVNGSVLKAVFTLLICMTIPFGVCILHTYRCQRCMDVEIALLRQVPKQASEIKAPVNPIPLYSVRCVILAVALICLFYGFFTGGTADVLVKAINICTECVGLG